MISDMEDRKNEKTHLEMLSKHAGIQSWSSEKQLNLYIKLNRD